ncbi:MAG: CCA tRNA nucleotidyltransferase [Lachnospiraceae bacterium]
MQIQLPTEVRFILDTLMQAGYDAYAVGGCVRDSILDREPDDWDITTAALPIQVKALFKRTIDTGIQHGTVTVLLQKQSFEITTYRIDGEYKDNRHPSEVIFTPSLTEDLRRRDFTINAMAYNETTGIIDEFGGIQDLQSGVIRCVGDAIERFREDALRIMRAIRFSAQLNYRIEPTTEQAIRSLAPTLSKISAERIQVELTKLVTSNHPEALKLAYETGITGVILPELDAMMRTTQHNPHHCYSVGEHTLRAMETVRKDKLLRLAVLLHDIGKPNTKTTDPEGIDHFYGHAAVGQKLTKQILRRLKYDNDTIEAVSTIVAYHDDKPSLTPTGVRRAIVKIGASLFPYVCEVKRADIEAQSTYKKQEKLAELETLQALYTQILAAHDCLSLKELALTGRDLIEIGMTPGKELGDTLHHLLELVLEHPEYNTRTYLLQQVQHKN